MSEPATMEVRAIHPDYDRPLTAIEIRAQVNRIQEVLEAVMKEDVHYGTIPGTPKPTLYKPGAEKILVTFRIAAGKPIVEDLSSADEIRYRTVVEGLLQADGRFLGAGIGECSSNEEKYKWRRPVCDEEWEETPEDRRREKWMRGKTGPYKAKQVRTNPSDVANTILKMAVKRGLIAMTLVVTAASDVFAQDLEDLPEEVREAVVGEEAAKATAAPIAAPQRKSQPEAPATPAKPATNGNGHDAKTKLWNHCLHFANGDEAKARDLLQNLTSFTNKKGERIPGKRDIGAVSDQAAAVTLRMIDKTAEVDPASEVFHDDNG